jgi:hypothetical protein
MLTAEQTVAIRRKSGAHRGAFCFVDHRHDFAKVNAAD